jgi:hypothetical protein
MNYTQKMNKNIRVKIFIFTISCLFLCGAEAENTPLTVTPGFTVIPSNAALDFYWCVYIKRELEEEKAVTSATGAVLLKTGDKLSFYIEPKNPTSYIYLLVFDKTEDCLLLYPRDIDTKRNTEIFSLTLEIISRGMINEICLIASPARLKNFEQVIRQVHTTPEGNERDQLLYNLRLMTNLFIKKQWQPRSSFESFAPFGGIYRQRAGFKKIRVKGPGPYGRKIRFTY